MLRSNFVTVCSPDVYAREQRDLDLETADTEGDGDLLPGFSATRREVKSVFPGEIGHEEV